MKRIFLFFLIFLTWDMVYAANISSNAVSGSWNNPSSWVGGVVPGVNDSVIIVNGSNISLNTDATVYKLRVSSGGVLNIGTHTLKLNGNGSDKGSLTLYGTFNLNSGTLELTGDFFTGTSAFPGTFNCGTGTVNFTGNEHQMISGQTPPVFYHFITSNTNNALQKGLSGHPVNTTIKGNFVANGVFNRSSDNNYPVKVTFDGNTTLSGLYSFFLHNIVINDGATLNAGNKTIYIYGNWTNNGTFICGTGTLWFAYDPSHPAQPNQNIINFNAASNPFNNIYINKTTGSVTPLAHSSDPSNPSGHIWVNGNFTVNNGTWVNGNRHLYVKRDFIVNNGTFNAGNGILRLNGDSQQLLRTNANSPLYQLYMENTDDGAQLVSNIRISNLLLLTNGHIYTSEAYEVYVSNNATGSVSYTNQGSFIVGRLRREIGSSVSNYLFPIGPMNVTPLKYRPVTYQQTSNGGASNISIIADTISWGGTHTANWYVRINSDAGNPVGNLLFQYNLGADFPVGVNECALSVNRGTLPLPANWNFVLSTVTGASGGSLGGIVAAVPATLAPHAYIIGEAVPQLNNTSVCNGNAVTLDVVQPTGSGSFNWYDAANGGNLLQPNAASYTTPPLLSTTTYYVAHVNSTTSCIANYRFPVTVTVGPSMSVNIIPNGPTAICGTGSVVLDAGSAYSSYSWSTGAATQTITATTQGTYSVTVSDGMGCSGDGSINVSIMPFPDNAGTISGPTTICVGDNGVFSIPAVPNATGYQWDVPSGMSVISGHNSNTVTVASYASGSGVITVTPFNDCGSGGANSISIIAATSPDDPQSISGPNNVCEGEIATYTIPYVSGATGYTWQVPPTANVVSGGTTNSITIDWGTSTTGTISVIPYNDCGNGNATSIYVTVNQLPPAINSPITGPVIVCQGEMVNYSILPVNNATGYIWEVPLGISIIGGQNTSTITVEWQHVSSGYIYVVPTNGCGVGTGDSIYVLVLPAPPRPQLNDTLWVCEDELYEIIVSSTDTSDVYWYDQQTGGTPVYVGDTLSLQTGFSNQTLWVEVQAANGCYNPGGRVRVDIVVLQKPHVVLTTNMVNNTIVLGQAVIFTALPAQYPNYSFYVNNQIVQSGTSNEYTTNILKDNDNVSVVVTDLNGCTKKSEIIEINVKSVPNAFSPNGDGVNDIFMEGIDMVIINRWGQTLYEGNEGWDGRYKGKYVSPGTYFYIITLSNDNEISNLTGSVIVTK